jgi:ribosome-binding protein aMBF1 (putative translation factor)
MKPKAKRHARSRPRTHKEVHPRRQAGGQKRPRTKPLPTLGENIKTARTKKGMTQLALAHAIGYTGDDAGAYISRVESNTQAPRIDTLLRIAEALGVAMCSLLAK